MACSDDAAKCCPDEKAPTAVDEAAAEAALKQIAAGCDNRAGRFKMAGPGALTGANFWDVVSGLRAEGVSFWTILHRVADIMSLIPELASVAAVVQAILKLLGK